MKKLGNWLLAIGLLGFFALWCGGVVFVFWLGMWPLGLFQICFTSTFCGIILRNTTITIETKP